MRSSATAALLFVLLSMVPATTAAPEGSSEYDVMLDLDFYVTDDRPPKPMIDVIFTSSEEVAGYQIGFKTDEGAPGTRSMYLYSETLCR